MFLNLSEPSYRMAKPPDFEIFDLTIQYTDRYFLYTKNG